MKALVLATNLLLFAFCTYAQRQNNTIEIQPYFRYDKYPQFAYAVNSISARKINIQGKSYGVSVAYGHGLSRDIKAKFGIGYYRLSFNKIDAENRYGNPNSRVIDYPSPLFIIFSTNKYWYHTVSASIGIDKVFYSKKDLFLSGGLNISNFFSFSQYYRIKQDYPTGPPDNRYMRYKKRNVSASVDLQLAVNKRLGERINLGPMINLPIFSIWALDDAFSDGYAQEYPSKYKSKWLTAYAVGLQLSYSLHPYKK